MDVGGRGVGDVPLEEYPLLDWPLDPEEPPVVPDVPLEPEDEPVSTAPPHAVREAPTIAPLAAREERNLRRSWRVRMTRDRQGSCAERDRRNP